VEKFSDNPENKEAFRGFEGDSIVLRLLGDKTITFTVKNGKLVALDGEVQNATAIAEIDAKEFCKFIDGRLDFAGLFSTDYPKYFRNVKGAFYDFGGDFTLLAPICDKLTKLYKEDSAFRDMIDKYKTAKT
jgi:hypothetical protein